MSASIESRLALWCRARSQREELERWAGLTVVLGPAVLLLALLLLVARVTRSAWSAPSWTQGGAS